MHPLTLKIAVDGTAASGKSTISRMLAQSLDLQYLNSGNIYKSIAEQVITNNIATKNIESILNIARQTTIESIINKEFHCQKISEKASEIAAITELRKSLLEMQVSFANSHERVLIEGRDIGSIIMPNANIKFYITASLKVRSQRRIAQLKTSNNTETIEQMTQKLYSRDHRDSHRKDAPLVVSKNAVIIDTSNITTNDALTFALNSIEHITS